jgi:hypothetical protein
MLHGRLTAHGRRDAWRADPAVATEVRPEDRDLGFGSVVAREERGRFLNRDGTFSVHRDGLAS